MQAARREARWLAWARMAKRRAGGAAPLSSYISVRPPVKSSMASDVEPPFKSDESVAMRMLPLTRLTLRAS